MTARHKNASGRQKWFQRRLNVKRIFSSSLGAMLGIGIVAYLSTLWGVNSFQQS